jgi:hypothetical protein
VALSSRIFIVGTDDTIYRLAETKFSGMLHDPSNYPLPHFAGQRLRMASATVELQDRLPYRVIRVIYKILQFDDQGGLDIETFNHQNAARVDVMLENTLPISQIDTAIIDASSRFIAQGGRWNPSASLEWRICQAALNELKYVRLSFHQQSGLKRLSE